MRIRRVAFSLCLLAVGCGGSGPSSDPSGSTNSNADKDGDGISVQQGDCNDADARVKPGGGFDFRGEYSRSGRINCAHPPTGGGRLVVRNNSCAPLTLVSLQRLQEDCVVPPVVGDYTAYIPSIVAAGSEVEFLKVNPYESPERCCCTLVPVNIARCRAGGLCESRMTYTLTTSQGTQTYSHSTTIDWSECELCPPTQPDCNP